MYYLSPYSSFRFALSQWRLFLFSFFSLSPYLRNTTSFNSIMSEKTPYTLRMWFSLILKTRARAEYVYWVWNERLIVIIACRLFKSTIEKCIFCIKQVSPISIIDCNILRMWGWVCVDNRENTLTIFIHRFVSKLKIQEYYYRFASLVSKIKWWPWKHSCRERLLQKTTWQIHLRSTIRIEGNSP